MNISYSWLKEFIHTDMTPEQVGEALTSIGLELGTIEEVETIRGGLKGLVIGKVLTCIDHPDSDHLHITTVDLGGGNVQQIVCGAPNVAAGQTVVVATVGTTLYDGDKEFQIKKSKIRGVESFGMICAEDEIGVGTSHDGIIVIDGDDKPAPGTPAAEYYNLQSDFVLEVDLTPNRIDGASHYGVARDLSAWMAEHKGNNGGLHLPSVDAFAVDDASGRQADVTVEDTEGCVRYCGLTINDVTVAESPDWLKNRLTAIGQRPINNIVDITNYVLMSVCQPMHCFDLDNVKGDRIVVRTCPQGTPFVTLDGVEHKLDASDLMICDAEGPMCIAGVFGGLKSGVTESAKSVFLESACFNPTRVRRTARRHGLSTDASFRFERGVDPNGCVYALMLAALMVKELAGGKITGEIRDIYPAPVKPAEVTLDTDYMNKLVGIEIPDADVDTILDALEIETVEKNAGSRLLRIPTYRVDVTRPCDVVEDILRIYGFNNVPMTGVLHATLSYKTDTDAADDLRRTIAEQLTGAGFSEILNNSLTARGYYDGLTAYPAEKCVMLLNPLSQDLNAMRQTLLFGGLESLEHNINRKNKDLAFYETGNVYSLNPGLQPTADKPLAPYSQSAHIALWMTGDARNQTWNAPAEESTFFHLKAHVLNMLARLGVNMREVTMKDGAVADNNIYAQYLTVDTRNGKHLGSLGIIDKAVARKAGIKQDVYYAEFDFDALVRMALRHKTTYTELPKTQPVRRDLALLIDKAVTMADIENTVREAERRLLRGVELFDVYEGKNLPEGKKSYAIAITLQDSEKTLNDKAIDATMAKIVAQLTRKLGAELR